METTTTATSEYFHQFPVSSPRRMPCKHWQQFPIRSTCVECVDDFCDKCRLKLPPYDPDEKSVEYQHEKHFYDFIHHQPKAEACDHN